MNSEGFVIPDCGQNYYGGKIPQTEMSLRKTFKIYFNGGGN
jgi:hypothetical protein